MVGLGKKGVSKGGGDCLNYLKRGWNRKEGRGNKYLKKGGGGWQAGPRGGCPIKGGGVLEPLYKLWLDLQGNIY